MTNPTKYEFPNYSLADTAAVELHQAFAGRGFDTKIESLEGIPTRQIYTITFPKNAEDLSGNVAITFEYNGLGNPPYVECDFGTSLFKMRFQKFAAGIMGKHCGTEVQGLNVA